MIGTHVPDELIELLAALILSIGGGLILVRAALQRVSASRPLTVVAPVGNDRGVYTHDSQGRATIADLGLVRRAGAWVAAGLSLGAAAIHLAAGSEHVAALGDLGLAFYCAALFQAVTAFALLGQRYPRRLAWITIAGNLAILVAWTWSRVVGLPTVPGGPESIGIADAIAAILQAALVILLAIRLRGFDVRWSMEHRAAALRSGLTGGLVASLGVIALSTVIAVNAAAAGHDEGHGTTDIGQQHAMPMLLGSEHGHGAMTAP